MHTSHILFLCWGYKQVTTDHFFIYEYNNRIYYLLSDLACIILIITPPTLPHLNLNISLARSQGFPIYTYLTCRIEGNKVSIAAAVVHMKGVVLLSEQPVSKRIDKGQVLTTVHVQQEGTAVIKAL
jgi:hypothetical protein